MFKSTQSHDSLPLDWEVLLPAGPALAQHVGCIIGNSFYIHGGITEHGNTTPSNKLYQLDLSSMIWNEVRQPNSPALSHHVAVTLENRYMLLIGGWDGQKRTSTIYAFDTKEQKWLFPKDTGFPEGAGLSSHAASLLSTGEILIIGREGCLKMKLVKKHGNAYLLSGSIQKGEFTYRKISDNTGSRSGHTINTVNNTAFIVGGRNDDLIEFHCGYSSNEHIGRLNSNFMDVLKNFMPLSKMPNGRKNHVAFVGKDCLIIHGGETFDGRSREAVGEMFLVTMKPHLAFYKIGNSKVARASHVCVSTGDRVIFHGGMAWKNVIYGDCYELKLREVGESQFFH